MDQQPEQQSTQPQTQPVTELPPVPVVANTSPVPSWTVPQEPIAQEDSPQPEVTPQATESPAAPFGQVAAAQSAEPPVQAPIVSEPMGRPQASGGGLEWRASEYVDHDRSLKWFIILGVVALGLAALAVFLLKNYTFAILIVVMAVAIAVLAKRPANEVQYQLNSAELTVNGKHFAIHNFRTFGVLQDGGIYAVVLLPNKRFSPGVTIYFPHELGEQIVDTLGASLPMQDMQPDWIDKLTRKLNF